MSEWEPEDPDAWKAKWFVNPSFTEADDMQAGYDSAADIVADEIREKGIDGTIEHLAKMVRFMRANESGVKKVMGSGYCPYVQGRLKYYVEFINRHVRRTESW